MNQRNATSAAGNDPFTNSVETITETETESGPSRRSILSTLAAGAGAMAFAGTAGAMTTQEEGDGNGDSGGNNNSGGDGGDEPSNVDVLNYALTLEHLEDQFYKQGLNDFSDGELRNAESLCNRNAALNEDVPTRIQAISDHEAAHVDTITQVIEDLGGDPVEAACYDFGYESPSDFLGVAQVLENTGVAAYDGAIHFFDNDDLATAGATIATVEARHASYLNTLNGADPFPRAFDEAKSMEEIKEAAGQFIVECEDD